MMNKFDTDCDENNPYEAPSTCEAPPSPLFYVTHRRQLRRAAIGALAMFVISFGVQLGLLVDFVRECISISSFGKMVTLKKFPIGSTIGFTALHSVSMKTATGTVKSTTSKAAAEKGFGSYDRTDANLETYLG